MGKTNTNGARSAQRANGIGKSSGKLKSVNIRTSYLLRGGALRHDTDTKDVLKWIREHDGHPRIFYLVTGMQTGRIRGTLFRSLFTRNKTLPGYTQYIRN